MPALPLRPVGSGFVRRDPLALARRLALAALAAVLVATPSPAGPSEASARTAATTVDDAAFAAHLPVLQRRAALQWLERLESHLGVLREDARRAHWRAIADALLLAGDARGALLVSRTAEPAQWSAWIRARIDGRLDLGDGATVVALAHLLERFDAPDPDAARLEMVRACALMGRRTWAEKAAAGDARSSAQLEHWILEGRVRRELDLDQALAALAELVALEGSAPDDARRIALRRALDAGAFEVAVGLLDELGTDTDGARARTALALWRFGRRADALDVVDPAQYGADAAVHLAAGADLPSRVLEQLHSAVPAADLAGRSRLALALAHALALEGSGTEAWERAGTSTVLDAAARLSLAIDLERGGDADRATRLAASDPWSAALLDLWRAGRAGRTPAFDSVLLRARNLADAGAGDAARLAELLVELGAGEEASDVALSAIAEVPASMDADQLERLVRADLRLDGGRALARRCEELASAAGRTVISAAAVRVALGEPY
ncbi:hypothetical protein Pla163_26100 [Planctomycetes bacterium Pla163]|uniref:HEAT repeat protein n=2 Tax=Rohdeia mirabilis TaxID=2528008 RepID=A0A518D1Z9_9BACT|nr:hypothetical protein Pla163_26100 [Planctomycetes bacterium Pla163]